MAIEKGSGDMWHRLATAALAFGRASKEYRARHAEWCKAHPYPRVTDSGHIDEPEFKRIVGPSLEANNAADEELREAARAFYAGVPQ